MTIEIARAAPPEQRVKFIDALREIVRERTPPNSYGGRIVSDYDLIWSTDTEREKAWEHANCKI